MRSNSYGASYASRNHKTTAQILNRHPAWHSRISAKGKHLGLFAAGCRVNASGYVGNLQCGQTFQSSIVQRITTTTGANGAWEKIPPGQRDICHARDNAGSGYADIVGAAAHETSRKIGTLLIALANSNVLVINIRRYNAKLRWVGRWNLRSCESVATGVEIGNATASLKEINSGLRTDPLKKDK